MVRPWETAWCTRKANEGPPGVRDVRERSSEGLLIEMGSEKKSKTLTRGSGRLFQAEGSVCELSNKNWG